MRIEDLQVTPIALGDPPLLNASGLHAPYALRIVLEVITESGLTGLSEIPGDADVLAGLMRLRSELRGTSVFDTQAIRNVVARTFGPDESTVRGDQSFDQRRVVHAVSALEVACLDIAGKRLGCRVADLLGGVVRERVPFAGYLFFKYAGAGGSLSFDADASARGWSAARQAAALTPDELVAQARSLVEVFGFSSLKIKAGILPPDVEVGAALALREAFGPEMPLRIDPNAAWSYETALEQGRRLQGIIEYYEDPVRGREAMARLRSELPIPLATNMCTTGFEDLPLTLANQSEDIILADHHFWGGLRACMDLAAICGVIGRGLTVHSNSHAGISLAAMVQLGAALPTAGHAFDTHYPWQEDEVIVGGKLQITDGCVSLPTEPGLGVSLDRDALKRLHANYVACGLVRRDDEREMRKKDPDWRFQRTRY